MRRPVGVKSILDRLGWSMGFLSTESAAVAMLPSALSRSDSYSLGACWAFSFQPVLPSVCRPAILLLQSGTRARRLTQSPELGFGLLSLSFPGTVWFLRGCGHGCWVAVVQRFVHLSAHPQVVQQHRQLSGRSPFYLCLEHVDNLGAYSASRPETGLLIPSDFNSREENRVDLYGLIQHPSAAPCGVTVPCGIGQKILPCAELSGF